MFFFCPRCAGKLSPRYLSPEIVQYYQCTACQFVFWQNSKPTVSAILERGDGAILLTKRGIEPYRGDWDLPGGYLQNGEEPIIGLHRELREELGVEIRVGNIVGIYSDQYGEGGDYTLNIFYRATIQSGSVQAQDDVSGYAWVDPRQLPGRLAFPCLSRAISDYIAAR